jgi:hypothetical protein
MNKSIYESIKEAIVDGQLPDDFSLPDLTVGEEDVSFADGAIDGITMYHMPPFEMTEENYQVMTEAINSASNHEFEISDSLFIQLSEENRAISISGKLQHYIIDNQDNLKAGNLYEYALGLIQLSDNRECVKYGLLVLGLLVTNNEEVKDIIRILALSDEFTLFCIHIMYTWSGGNNDIFETARKVHGWGRIHALELLRPLMPRAEEIREWMLKEGINNSIAPFYSALTCWRNANIGSVLYADSTYEDLYYIGKILDAMLDESAVPGISTLDKRIDILLKYLEKIQKYALCAEDYEVIDHIYRYGEAVNAAEVSQSAKKMLNSGRAKSVLSDFARQRR